jgi:hypothetical protein
VTDVSEALTASTIRAKNIAHIVHFLRDHTVLHPEESHLQTHRHENLKSYKNIRVGQFLCMGKSCIISNSSIYTVFGIGHCKPGYEDDSLLGYSAV